MHHARITMLLLAAFLSGCGGGGDSGPTPVVKILFVGNSYTFARVKPALQYNAAKVKDLTAAFNAADPTGTNSFPVGTGAAPQPCATPGTACFEPHDWGGVPGIFKRLTDQAGLIYDVSHSTRNAATMRGQFLNTANAKWDMRGNIASQKWDVVVLQGQSDEPLPAAKAKNGNFVSFSTYVDQLEKYVHAGAGMTTTEADIFGSLSRCTAATNADPPGAGLSNANCTATRVIPANSNANAAAKVYLQQTWARPDMVSPHKCTAPDITTPDGAPIFDPGCSSGTNGNPATGQNNLYYTSNVSEAANLRDMTTDMHNVFYGVVASNPRLAGVVPVGDAFQRAVDMNHVKNSNFYEADGTYDESGLLNLWWLDRTHESVHGAYLSALVMYGTITGRDPQAFGTSDLAFQELGIAAADALMLQQVAHDTLVAAGVLPR